MGTKMSVGSTSEEPNDEIPSNVSSISADVILNEQSQAEIFKLKMDHFEELFDWLSMEDIIMLGKTCKRMQQIVGYCFKTKYTAAKFECKSYGIYTRDAYDVVKIKVDGLSVYLRKLLFYDLEHIRYDHSKQKWKNPTGVCIPHMKVDRFKSLTEIRLIDIVLTDKGISRIKEILGQLETVKLKYPRFLDENADFYENFLQFCTNVKMLCIQEARNRCIFVGVDNSWLRRKYPTLEHVELTAYFDRPIDELQRFFQQNTNINTFATDVEMILVNSDTFKNTEAKWDVLSVRFSYLETLISCRDLLNELYARGRFKQLHVYFPVQLHPKCNQDAVNQLGIYNGITKLFINSMEKGTDLSPLINLKHLCIKRASDVTNMEILAKQLVNLESIQFTFASINHILPFIRYSPKLNKIVVFRLENYENNFKIEELNEDRSKLISVRKVTVYIAEHDYLKLKWARNVTNQSLIELRRYESYEALNNNFYYIPT